MEKMTVHGRIISVSSHVKNDDYISITDIAKHKDEQNPRFIIQNWMRNRNTVEFLGFIVVTMYSTKNLLNRKQADWGNGYSLKSNESGGVEHDQRFYYP